MKESDTKINIEEIKDEVAKRHHYDSWAHLRRACSEGEKNLREVWEYEAEIMQLFAEKIIDLCEEEKKKGNSILNVKNQIEW